MGLNTESIEEILNAEPDDIHTRAKTRAGNPRIYSNGFAINDPWGSRREHNTDAHTTPERRAKLLSHYAEKTWVTWDLLVTVARVLTRWARRHNQPPFAHEAFYDDNARRAAEVAEAWMAVRDMFGEPVLEDEDVAY